MNEEELNRIFAGKNSNNENIEGKQNFKPRDIFMALRNKLEKYQNPWDIQTDIWSKWYEKRNNKDLIVKMGIGTGKTVVGLLILESCRLETNEPVMYVVPDKMLVNQVKNEAQNLGLNVVVDGEGGKIDACYFDKTAIYITVIDKLYNGKSQFGIKRDYEIGSIIIDDVHACVEKMRSKHTLFFERDSQEYNILINEFNRDNDIVNLFEYGYDEDASLIPFYSWNRINRSVFNSIKEIIELKNNDEDFQGKYQKSNYFNFQFVKKYWKFIDCTISKQGIELSLNMSFMNTITSFTKAKRRIFMSATLNYSGEYVTIFNMDQKNLPEVIVSTEYGGYVGEKMILSPSYFNSIINDDDVRKEIIELSKIYNTAIIVPSEKKLELWNGITDKYIINSDNPHNYDILKKLNPKDKKVIFLVNRYDGIDLPNDFCRILVIDGLPPVQTKYEKAVSDMKFSRTIKERQMVKLEQGIGRGTRGVNDYCSVVLIGEDLMQIFVNNSNHKYLENSTINQFKISQEIQQTIKQNTQVNIETNIITLLCQNQLERKDLWMSMYKKNYKKSEDKSTINIDKFILLFDTISQNNVNDVYEENPSLIQTFITTNRETLTEEEIGFLMLLRAKYINYKDFNHAQNILKEAKKMNSYVTSVSKTQVDGENKAQISRIYDYVKKNNGVDCTDDLNFIVNNLQMNTNNEKDTEREKKKKSELFEEALTKLFMLLGFKATRPDKTLKTGPDVYVDLGNNEYLVIECKSNVSADKIKKEHSGQLQEHVSWAKKHNGNDKVYHPIFVIDTNVFFSNANPLPETTVIDSEKLKKIVDNIMEFYQEVICNIEDENYINILINKYKFSPSRVKRTYTKEIMYE